MKIRKLEKDPIYFQGTILIALLYFTVDPETYKVYAAENVNGQEEWTHLTCEPSTSLPLAGKYFLF